MTDDLNLTPGERELLEAAEDDEIDLGWACIHLGVRTNGGPGPVRATPEEIDACFHSLARLHDLGLISVGRMEYVDGGPPGRLAPVRHVGEPIDMVKQRVREVARNASDDWAWHFSAWIALKDSEAWGPGYSVCSDSGGPWQGGATQPTAAHTRTVTTQQLPRTSELETVEAETARIMRTGTIWLAAVIIAAALLLGPSVAAGWRPQQLAVPLDIGWWLGATAAAVGVALLVWAGCPVMGFPLAEAHRQKVPSMRVGIVLSLSGIAFAGLMVLLAPI